MVEANIFDTLISKLSKYYDSSVHSEVDLRMREQVSDKGSLCGMAAVYQAGLQTLLSISEIKQMSYNDVKVKIGEKIGLDESDSKKAVDLNMLQTFYDGKMFMNYLPLKYNEICLRNVSATSDNHYNYIGSINNWSCIIRTIRVYTSRNWSKI